ncbi:transcriptional regulator, LacI family [Filimonas lacunae]|uniref:Transcriptional regulator, LacI family n=1 Tax=Filimonas lacunae TaxID=477680 RepID=A0A173MGY8_9BACT|nr:LacI family DNA-binding transcriptional regulator [Filimonas lacunae]BAV06750.1 LacI family transcriptional regulator [Filimonas lacunae]SIT34415.1 transcriptional regulator, LacI family [Filimonas lacunae]
MSGKRATIYHIAEELGMSASYVSRALNDHPLVSQKIKEKVKKKAAELNYRHNSHAANLRQGSSKTMGVIIPHITQSFFSEAIAGIEEACFANNYSLIICQSHESFQQERKAIDTLVRQNVDCILISVSEETQSAEHLEAARDTGIDIIQFDRYLDKIAGYKVINDNLEAAYEAVKHLVNEKYKKIAFIGGPEHLPAFKLRKEGYIKGIKEAKLNIPFNYIVDNALSRERTIEAATELLSQKDKPDAFITVSDTQALAILQLAESLKIEVPQQLGILGFANESFTELLRPTLTSVDQQSKELGKQAANLYFGKSNEDNTKELTDEKLVIPSKIITRQSTLHKGAPASASKSGKRTAAKA